MNRLGKTGWAFLIFLTLLGGILRFDQLGGIGLAEDEAHKWRAQQHYRELRFPFDEFEHPMLMKVMITASAVFADFWNRNVAGKSKSLRISPEGAARFPCALLGALSVLLMGLVGRRLFGRKVGFIAALLWAVEINIVAYSRIAKEDSFVTFFFLLGVLAFLKAKAQAEMDKGGVRRYHLLGAAAFGALFASKYWVQFLLFGLMFYLVTRRVEKTSWRIDIKEWLRIAAVFFVTWIALNPSILFPMTYEYIGQYSSRNYQVEHGYTYLGTLYWNIWSKGPAGVPATFWPAYLFFKFTPLLLLAMVVGLYPLFRLGKSDGRRVIAFWLILGFGVYTLLGSKYARWLISAVPPLIFIAALGVVFVERHMARLFKGFPIFEGNKILKIAGGALIPLALAVPNLILNVQYSPHHRMYLNFMASHPKRNAHYFPHCDFYDDGARETIRYICKHAPKGAWVVSSIPWVVDYYAEQYGRTDLKSVRVSRPGHYCHPGSFGPRAAKECQDNKTTMKNPCPEDEVCYTIAQEGRTSFENRAYLARLRKTKPLFVHEVLGVPALRVYRSGKQRPFQPVNR